MNWKDKMNWDTTKESEIRYLMFNKEALYNELTDAFIEYQYRLDNPFPSKTETPEVMVLRYRSDPIFHNKVQSLVQGVMSIVLRHSKV
jgi:hypothetical protein